MIMNRIDILKTVNILSLALLVFYLLFRSEWLLWLTCALTLGNAFESKVTAWIAKSWLKFAHHLGNFNSKAILSIIFFIVLTPIAFAFRLFHKNTVEHFTINGRDSYFDDLKKQYKKSDFEKVW